MTDRSTEDPALHAFLDDVTDVAADDTDAALALLDEGSPSWQEHPEVLYFRGDLHWTLNGPEAAEPFFRSAIERDPRFADAHHQQCLQHLLRRCDAMEAAATRGAVRFPRLVAELLRSGLDLRNRHAAADRDRVATALRCDPLRLALGLGTHGRPVGRRSAGRGARVR